MRLKGQNLTVTLALPRIALIFTSKDLPVTRLQASVQYVDIVQEASGDNALLFDSAFEGHVLSRAGRFVFVIDE